MLTGLTWNTLVGGVALLLILSTLSIATLLQANHDALVALVSLVSGAGIGVGATSMLMTHLPDKTGGPG